MDAYNPIVSIKHSPFGVEKHVPPPDTYQVSIQKTSKEGAGRTEDWRMKTMFTGKLIQMNAEWQDVSIEDAKTITNALDPDNKESIIVKFLTPQYGIISDEMYSGDIPAPLLNTLTNRWESITVSLTSIESKWRAT